MPTPPTPPRATTRPAPAGRGRPAPDRPAPGSGERFAGPVLLLGLYLWGLGAIAALPPFEGFDEPGHYSYIEQLAWTGAPPRRGDPMAAEVDRYLAAAPTAPAVGPRLGYAAFFAAPPETVAAGREVVHGAGAAAFEPGAVANWEAQHPPLYYALMAPVARLAAPLSLGGRLLVLRAVSYTLAAAGLALAWLAARRVAALRGAAPTALSLAPLLWPLLLPMWFPDMARLGNDSLVVLIVGVAGLLVFGRPGAIERPRGALALGLLVGAGLLAKATVLPLAAAVLTLAALRAARAWRAGAGGGPILALTLCAGTAAAVAGWWYVGQALATGDLIGSNDAVALRAEGGLAEGLRHHGSLTAFLRMPAVFAVSMVWAGTWSFVFPPIGAALPLFAASPLLAVAGLARLKAAALGPPERLAAIVLALFVAGLAYQSVILIATVGAAAPAWYLQSFLPVLWPLLGVGIAGALHWRASRWAFAALLAYTPLFLALMAAVQALHFTGCGTLAAGSRRFDLGSAAACLADPAGVIERLGAIAFPRLALALALPGWLLLALGCALALGALGARPASPGRA